MSLLGYLAFCVLCLQALGSLAAPGILTQSLDEKAPVTILDTNIHYPKYDDNVSFQGLLKFAPTL